MNIANIKCVMEEGKRLRSKIKKRMVIFLSVILLLIAVKACWVMCATSGHGSFEGEKKEIIRRANYLTSKVATTPQQLLDDMPGWIGEQFQGEWALYSCSMTCAALANIAIIYPDNREMAVKYIGQIIDIALSPEIREYDRTRWNEDPLDGIDGDLSHISYYSHLAWMISAYKRTGGDGKYDEMYHSLCAAMNRRIRQSSLLNVPTYPGECIYVPDMLVAIVALANYSRQYDGEYSETVKMWVERAKKEWIDKKTGLLASFLPFYDGTPIKGSYSALNCYYLTFIDEAFARDQYEKLKQAFLKRSLITGFREYHKRSCLFRMDIDAGPIIFGFSPSGTAFAIGAATFFHDTEVRKGLLRTAEIAGFTVTWFGKSHYLLSNIALVGEAIVLAMRTATPWYG